MRSIFVVDYNEGLLKEWEDIQTNDLQPGVRLALWWLHNAICRPFRHKLKLHAALCYHWKILGHGFYPYTALAFSREWYVNIGWPCLCIAQFAVIFNSMQCNFRHMSALLRFVKVFHPAFLCSHVPFQHLKTWTELPSPMYCEQEFDLLLFSVYWPRIKFCEVSLA